MKNSKVFIWSISVALGGFLFGFDTAVISGAEKSIQVLWKLDALQHGFTISIALIGTVIGAIFGGIPSDALGRKKTLLLIAALYLLSAVGTAFAFDWYSFLVFRFLGGLGVGASSVTAPMYISEIAPPTQRGKLVGLFQFNIVFGILISYLSNYLFAQAALGEDTWRWMLGIQALPSALFLFALLYVPESPRWLIVKQNKLDEARRILQISASEDEVNQEIAEILATKQENQTKDVEPFFSAKYFTPISLAFLFAMFNQLSGINAIIYYAPRIFEMTGLGKESALLSSAGIGLVNFTFTLLALQVIDKFGRKTLMLIGSVGLIVTLGLVARAFYVEDFKGYAVPAYLFVYIAFFAFSQGAVIWVFISEIFPNQVRAKGQALGSSTHWVMAALIAFTFPMIAEKLGGGHTFLIFTVMMVLQLLFVWRMMPETKNTSLEQLGNKMIVH